MLHGGRAVGREEEVVVVVVERFVAGGLVAIVLCGLAVWDSGSLKVGGRGGWRERVGDARHVIDISLFFT
jgi:hypothetical protein